VSVTDTTEMFSEEGYEVELPSGARTKVLTTSEVAYVQDKCLRYFEHNHFTNISDIQDVDKLIILETQIFRIGIFLGQGGRGYDNKAVDEPELRRSLSSFSTEVRQLKKILGIDKQAREAERGEASVSGYLDKLRQRAREFGIHRNKQAAKVVELGMQLIALATYHKNTTDEERRELGITLQDLYEWIMDRFAPELQALDVDFRKVQTMWIQDQ
jgi:hypothetical protein